MEYNTAKKVIIDSQEYSKGLSLLLHEIKEATEEEFERYKLTIAKLLADIFIDIIHPIVSEHPDLKPIEIYGNR